LKENFSMEEFSFFLTEIAPLILLIVKVFLFLV